MKYNYLAKIKIILHQDMGDDWYKTNGLFLTAVKKLGISQLGKQIMFHKNYEIDIASV